MSSRLACRYWMTGLEILVALLFSDETFIRSPNKIMKGNMMEISFVIQCYKMICDRENHQYVSAVVEFDGKDQKSRTQNVEVQSN